MREKLNRIFKKVNKDKEKFDSLELKLYDPKTGRLFDSNGKYFAKLITKEKTLNV